MKPKTKILSLKSIKIGFDIVFVFLIILVSLFLVFSILDISFLNITKGQFATEAFVERLDDNNSIDIFSRIDNSKVDSKVSSYNIILDLKNSNNKSMLIIYQITNFLTLSLGVLLIIFIVFHIRKILKSIIKGLRNNNDSDLKHYIFTNSNIRRFRYIGISFIIAPFIDFFLLKFNSYFISKYFYVKEFGVKLKPVAEFSDIFGTIYLLDFYL